MIESHKWKTNIGVAVGVILHLIGVVTVMATIAAHPDAGPGGIGLVGIVIGLVGTGVLVWGCTHYARGKGHAWTVGLLAILGLVGLIVLVYLRDRAPEGTIRGSKDEPPVVLALHGVDFSYGMVQALRGIDMKFQPGQVTCVIGRNGVGKTTLMQTIMGLLKHSAGAVALGERDVSRLAANERAKAGIALVPQGRQIFPKLTVEENLKVGLQARTDGLATIPEEIYELFPVLKQMSHRNGGDLSGGQQQQLAIARALAGDPKVLLLDEPTEGIQPNVIQQIGHVLRKLVTERNMTVVLVEQYLDFVKEFGHAFYVMNRGRVVAEGPTAELSDEVIDRHLNL
jgi:urea transport system ATP-binding protein